MALWRPFADLDLMDALALAGPLLEADPGLVPSGIGSICYRPADSPARRMAESDALDLLTLHGESSELAKLQAAENGLAWLVVSRRQTLYPSLVTDLRTASRVFIEHGLGARLVCAMTVFEMTVFEMTVFEMTVFEGPGKARAGLVYQYRRGTVYPFAPRADESRDDRLEREIADAIKPHVAVESDPTRWVAVRGAPGLS